MSIEGSQQDGQGHVLLRHGAPVMSERSYIVRRFEASQMDRVPAGQFSPTYSRGEKPIALLFEDIETGIITSDVAKFEKWMNNMKGREE